MDEYDVKPENSSEPPDAVSRVEPAPVLPYRPPARDRYPGGGSGSTVGPFVIGFFAAVAVCAGSFMLLGSTFDASQAIRVLSFLAVVGGLLGLFVLRAVLQSRFGFSGLGRGLAVGLMLGGIALVPCAGWAFLRLFET